MLYIISELSEAENDFELSFILKFLRFRIFEERRKSKEEAMNLLFRVIEETKRKIHQEFRKEKREEKKEKIEGEKEVKEKEGYKKQEIKDDIRARILREKEKIEREISYTYTIISALAKDRNLKNIISLSDIEIRLNKDVILSPDFIYILSIIQSIYEDRVRLSVGEKFFIRVKLKVKVFVSALSVLKLIFELIRTRMRNGKPKRAS